MRKFQFHVKWDNFMPLIYQPNGPIGEISKSFDKKRSHKSALKGVKCLD